ncbi:MAG: peptidylprolyl isomerase [Vulcanococcus sp.]
MAINNSPIMNTAEPATLTAESLLTALKDASSVELISLLFRFELAEPFLRQLKERAVVFEHNNLSDPNKVAEDATKTYCSKHGLKSQEEQQQWCLQRGMSRADLISEAIHDWRRTELREQFCGNVESLYLRYKDNLDRVLYSLIRVDDAGLCRELFYAIEAGEISFGEAARLHSRGPEAKTQGIVGPVDLTTPHPEIAGRLRTAQAGQLIGPFEAAEWHTLLRLEYRFDSEYDAHTQNFLEEMNFKSRICGDLKTELQQLSSWLQGQFSDATHNGECRCLALSGTTTGL